MTRMATVSATNSGADGSENPAVWMALWRKISKRK